MRCGALYHKGVNCDKNKKTSNAFVAVFDRFPLQPEFYITDVLFKVTLYNKNYFYDQLKLQETKDESYMPALLVKTGRDFLPSV